MHRSFGPIILAFAMFASSHIALAQGGGGGGSGSGAGSGSAGAGTSSGLSTSPGVNSPGTNSLGTAQSSGGAAAGASGTVGASGSRGGQIDGTVTNGPPLPGDQTIRQETSPNSKVDQTIHGICKGC